MPPLTDKPAPFKRKAAEPEAVQTPKEAKWWDRFTHPMNDEEFVKAFCEHVFANTDDYSLRRVRNQAYRFIRNFMAVELEQELTEYRKTHK